MSSNSDRYFTEFKKKDMKFKKGQIVSITFKQRKVKAIVIDPNGLGKNRPSVGFGFRTIARETGLPQSTLTDWVNESSTVETDRNNEEKTLKTPSGNSYKLTEILGSDNRRYSVIDINDVVDIAGDASLKPGKLKKDTRKQLIEFLKWFAVEGIYAAVYNELKGSFTKQDEICLNAWRTTRQEGIPVRNLYTSWLTSLGASPYDYAYWTDYIYKSLFNKTAKEMRKAWDCVHGANAIARNHLQKEIALKLVAYCERMTVELYGGNCQQAHDDAIKYTKQNYHRGLIK